MAKTIVLTGGGTAGHVTTNLNLIPLLTPHFERIVYLGSADGPEKKLLLNFLNKSKGVKKDENNFILEGGTTVEFYPIPVVKLRRSLDFSNLLIPVKLYKAVKQTKGLLEKIKPEVIFSKGGYVSLPVALASKNIPLVIHESDYSLGLANKIAVRYADVVATTFEDTAKKVKHGIYIGPPLSLNNSSSTLEQDKKRLRQKFNPDDLPLCVIMGGSQGAKSINEAVFGAVDELTKNCQIVHIVGRGKGNALRHKNYIQVEFVDDLSVLLSLANFAITRGGSNSLFELLAHQIPMLIIPLKKGSRGDQVENAGYFSKKGYALVLDDQDLNSATLIENFRALKSKAPIIMASMQNAIPSNSLTKLANIIVRACK